MIDQRVPPPVLFLIFNRPKETREAFDAIRRARPARLYVSADGPRNPVERELCEQTRAVVTEGIDWQCELRTRFSESNLGCKVGVSSAIDWFFQNEQEGIILEDDCVAHPSFFDFCSSLLEIYRLDNRIMGIAGSNLLRGASFGSASYYYSKYPLIWGWATWRRAWAEYDATMADYDKFEKDSAQLNWYHDDSERQFWTRTWSRVRSGDLDTWDYQWSYAVIKNNGLWVIPNVNLVSNIGFGETATHTRDANSWLSGIPTVELHSLERPPYVRANRSADYILMKDHFSIPTKQSKSGVDVLLDRCRRVLKRIRRRFNRTFRPIAGVSNVSVDSIDSGFGSKSQGPSTSPVMVNLGCGNRFRSGWINFDSTVRGQGVLRHDLARGVPLPTKSADLVYASHLLEHFSRIQSKALIEECWRVLKPQGIIRIVVPDLERIVREYIRIMDRLKKGDESEQANYDWIELELMDQMVRERSGGDMLAYLSDPAINNRAYLSSRIGNEAKSIWQRLDSTTANSESRPRPLRRWRPKAAKILARFKEALVKTILGDEYACLQLGRFRKSGEVHKWMYDQYSLRRLLRSAGFDDVREFSAIDSHLVDWSQWCLDAESDGTICKPDSLYLEGVKE